MTAQQEPVAALAASAPPVDTSPMYKALIEARLALLAVNSFASQVAIGLIDKVLNAAPDDASAPALQAGQGEPTCPACHGSGEGEAMEGRGPNTYTVTILCEECGGSGSIAPTHERAAPAPEPVQDCQATLGPQPGLTTGVSRQELIDWAAEQWHAQVAKRPMVNVHRRSLDDVWRQVLRHLGVDDRARLGPTHDELRGEITTKEWEAMNATPSQPVAAEGMKAWQISERMPSHHRQRTSLENINDVLEVLAASQPAEVVTEFPYTRTFWSIAAAVTIEGPNTKAISVKAFQDEWNRRAALSGSAESKGG